MDSRKTFRFPVEESIAALWIDHGRVRRVVGQTKDLSTDGVFFYLDAQPVEDSLIDVILGFPTKVTRKPSTPVACHGRVVRVELQVPAERFGVAVEIESCIDLAPAC
jgi:hypothetical protein